MLLTDTWQYTLQKPQDATLTVWMTYRWRALNPLPPPETKQAQSVENSKYRSKIRLAHLHEFHTKHRTLWPLPPPPPPFTHTLTHTHSHTHTHTHTLTHSLTHTLTHTHTQTNSAHFSFLSSRLILPQAAAVELLIMYHLCSIATWSLAFFNSWWSCD